MARTRRRRAGRGGKVISMTRRRRFEHLVDVAGADVKVGQPRQGATASRMVEFAHQVERVLATNGALPARSADRSLIGDLADLEWRTAVLWQAIRTFAAVPRRPAPTDEF